MFSPTESTKLTKSAIRKAHKLARIERKKRQKLEAREKAKRLLEPDTSISPKQPSELSADEPILIKQDLSEPSQFSQPVSPTTVIPVEVPIAAASSDSVSTSAPMALNGTSHQPPPEPPAEEDYNVKIESAPPPAQSAEQPPPTGIQMSNDSAKEKAQKRQNVLNRILWSLVMIGVFVGELLIFRLVTNFDHSY